MGSGNKRCLISSVTFEMGDIWRTGISCHDHLIRPDRCSIACIEPSSVFTNKIESRNAKFYTNKNIINHKPIRAPTSILTLSELTFAPSVGLFATCCRVHCIIVIIITTASIVNTIHFPATAIAGHFSLSRCAGKKVKENAQKTRENRQNLSERE